MLILNQRRWPPTGYVFHFDNCQLGLRSRPNRELPPDKILSLGSISGQTGFHHRKPIVLGLNEFISDALQSDRPVAGDRDLFSDLLVSTTNKTKKNHQPDRIPHKPILGANRRRCQIKTNREWTRIDAKNRSHEVVPARR
jgi:hypothetical protein